MAKQSILVSCLHALMIVLAFFMMERESDVYVFIGLAVWGIYLIAFICINRKSWMPWLSMLVFMLGTVLELALHWFGVIPAERSDFFAGGWNQVLYFFGLIAYSFVLVLLNLLLWLAHYHRSKAERK